MLIVSILVYYNTTQLKNYLINFSPSIISFYKLYKMFNKNLGLIKLN